MKKIIFLLILLLFSFQANADPGDFAVQLKGGPSFELHDFENQFKSGVEFDYQLDHGFTLNLAMLMGIGPNLFTYQMIPAIKANILYLYPAVIYLGYGLGFATLDADSGLAMRFTSGIVMPLDDRLDIITDLNLFMVPAGTVGTPVSFDWLIGMCFKLF